MRLKSGFLLPKHLCPPRLLSDVVCVSTREGGSGQLAFVVRRFGPLLFRRISMSF